MRLITIFVLTIFNVKYISTSPYIDWGDVNRDWRAAQKITEQNTSEESLIKIFSFPSVCTQLSHKTVK